ncbi:MAG: prepilin-type N-terminal cleavage/methylation domain-containing protein [Alkalinema sp. CAN_BIN05]|nr:prepilin-type N-terminal cleavage/methylation domain-containing protein [Alkalinema sp. CAN_BIN05]
MKFESIKKRFLKAGNRAAGFTLLELMIILSMIGILSAIAAPSWNRFYAIRQLNTAQDQIQGSIKLGQHLAKMQRRPYRFVIEQYGDIVRWGITTNPHKDVATDLIVPVEWKSCSQNISIDTNPDTNLNQTTFRKIKDKQQWFVVLDDDGTVTGQLGRVTLIAQGYSEQRCVIMSTLLGETRKGKNYPVKRDGFTCY